MKLPIKKKWFDQIKAGKKVKEFREAHITFICEETGEQLRKKVTAVCMWDRKLLPKDVKPIIKEEWAIVYDIR